MHLKSIAFASLLFTSAVIAAEPAAVTTFAESHPHAEYKHIFAANADCHTADADKLLIRKGEVIFFKTVPDPDKDKTLDARLEDGSIHSVTVSEFYKVSDVGAAGLDNAGPAAK
ncbi:MAG: hypothetical protein ACTHN5_09690 [Phycisphaerae bacterium]